jgi:hypothetical protein
MNERAKVTAQHLARQAIVYLRQSSAAQSSTIASRPSASMRSPPRRASSAGPRTAFSSSTRTSACPGPARSQRLTAEVALARVGLVLGLEVSRLARI